MSAPKGLNKGDTYEDGGRTMIVDKVLADGSYIVHAEGYEAPDIKEEVDLKAKLRAEIETEIRAQIMAELETPTATEQEPTTEQVATGDEGKDPILSANLVCQYCGKEVGSPIGLKSHEKACKMNPANLGGEQ